MNLRWFGQITVGVVAAGMISSAWGWDPSEPEGATPLNAEQIKAAFAGHEFNGTSMDYRDQYFEDGLFTGSYHDEHYRGRWWMDEKGDYICHQVFGKKHCNNVARDEDGNFCLYLWGAERPDACGMLEPL